jgi:cytochrome c biogenesis protein CcmG, thiol:disulfide interchange protein DsbE
MNDRKLRLMAIGFPLALLGLNVVFKAPLDKKQVADAARSIVEQRALTGQPARDFRVDLAGGGSFALADTAGRKVVILNFFTTWCTPCRSEMPELNRYAKSLAGKKAVLVGIDVSETEQTLAAFLTTIKVSYPIGRDADGKVAESYGVTSYPTTVVIGADGRIALVESGAVANAELAFDEPVNRGLSMIEKGQGIGRDAFLALPRGTSPKPTPDPQALTGRALAIAQKAPCPCGCSKKVLGCECQTATEIRKRLKTESLEGKDDAQVIQEIGRDFCKRMS